MPQTPARPRVPLLRPTRAARLLGVDRRTIGRWADVSRLGSVRLADGRRRFPMADVLRMIEQRAASSGPVDAARRRGDGPDPVGRTEAVLTVSRVTGPSVPPAVAIARSASRAARRRALVAGEAAAQVAAEASELVVATRVRADAAARRVREAVQRAAAVEEDLGPADTPADRARAVRIASVAEAAAAELEDDVVRQALAVAESAASAAGRVAAGLAQVERAVDAEVAATARAVERDHVGVLTTPTVSPGPGESVDLADVAELALAHIAVAYVVTAGELAAARAGSVEGHEQLENLRVQEGLQQEALADLVHEARTPLTQVVASAELLLEASTGPLNERQRRLVTGIERSGRRLAALAEDALTLASLAHEQVSRAHEPVDLGTAVRAVASALQPLVDQRRVRLTLVLTDAPVMVVGDANELERLVSNLVTNALKYTPDGGWVRCRLTVQGAAAHLEVADNGIGIPEDEQALLFTRFFRASSARRRGIPGTGLGLAIVEAIVRVHGGTVAVTSEPHRGTTFVVELPLGPQPHDHDVAVVPEPGGGGPDEDRGEHR